MKTKAMKKAWIIPLLILAAALLAAVILWGAGVISIPQFILDYLGGSAETDYDIQKEAAGRLISELKINEFTDYRSDTVNYSFIDGYRAFSQIKFNDSYYQRYELTYYNGGREYSQTRSVYRNGDKWRIFTYDADGNLLSTSISDGSRYYFRDDTQSEERIITGHRMEYFYSDAAYPSTDDLLTLLGDYGKPESEISECSVVQFGRSGNVSANNYELGKSGGHFFMIMDFTYSETGQRDEYVYILDNGMLYKADSYIGNDRIYSLSTIEFTVLDYTAEHDGIFMIP